MNIDPRPYIVEERLAGVRRVVAVTGWKGGIGKTLASVTLALILARRGFKTGLFDLDIGGTCCHVALGVSDVFPKEDKGLVPPEIRGVKFMTPAFFSENRAVPLRGGQISDAIIELFTITRWENLDFLILDMPPGINDAALDVMRFIPRAEVLAMTTPSVMARGVLERSLAMYRRLNLPVLGTIANMMAEGGGGIRRDPLLEEAVGDPDKILKTDFAADLEREASVLLGGL